MRGNITKRGDRTWLIRISLGLDADGKRKYHSKTVHGTKRKADKYLTDILKKVDNHEFVEPSRKTFPKTIDEWLVSIKLAVRERTHRDYEAVADRYLKPELGDVRLCDLDTSQIQELWNSMSQQGYSPRTVRYAAAVLKMALDYAVEQKLIARNLRPRKRGSLPRLARKEMRVLSQKETAAFLKKAKTDRLEAFFVLAVTSGMRPGEMLGLRWSDVDLVNGA